MLEKKLTRSAVEAAAEVLGLKPTDIDTVTLDEVKAAYRDAIRSVHPDTAGVMRTLREAAELTTNISNRILAAKKAKDLLQEWIEMRPDPACSVCGGSGYIRGSGFSSRECPRCMRGTRR